MAADVPLAWDASVSENIVGYKVYVGTASKTYGSPIAVGNQTAFTVTGLTPGTYYFAVTAFDADGNESDFSNEVSKTVSNPSSASCDINSDGSVNELDMRGMVDIILGSTQASGSSDLNTDGRVDALDLQILNNVILGFRSCP